MHPLVQGILSGDRRSLARAISVVDNKEPDSYAILSQVFYKTGKAKTVGFTGAGGAGKSSLIESLVPEFKKLGHKVAVLAVDPTSPITGGAILGDRIRMRSTMDDQSVFMRSIASRGATGGISGSVRNIIRILDAAGFTLIIVESVGAGQLEVQISSVVDVTAVVFSPQTGDNIQAIKAGLTEVGDLYVINKSDLEGSSTLFNSIADFVGDTPRKPMVTKASARKGDGVKDLAECIEKLLFIKGENYKYRERRMLELELKDIILAILEDRVSSTLMKDNKYQEYIEKIAKKEMDPYIVAKGFAAKLLM
jgi:LAO/AO transport system kinase